MEQILQLNEFFVEGGEQQKSHVLLHITEPSTPEERTKGYFFAVCEINNGDNAYIAELQGLIDKVENDYYATEEADDKNGLEMVLEKINQENLGLLKKEPTLHCIVGAVRQPDIIFSAYGTPELVLFYKNRQGLYQRMNLIAKEGGEPEPKQLFSQIIQGKISANDYLFAGTAHIKDYFDADRLQKIITTRPAKSSAEHLERVLGELKDGYSFGGLIIQVSIKEKNLEARKTRPVSGENSADSLTGLFATEQKTARTLAPSVMGRLNQKIKAAVQNNLAPARSGPSASSQIKSNAPAAEINALHRRAHEPAERATGQKRINKIGWSQVATSLKVGLANLGKGILWLLFVIWYLLQSLARLLALLFFVATNYQNRRRNIIEEWQRHVKAYRNGFLRLSKITQISILGLAVIMIIFIGSLIYIRSAQNKLLAKNQFEAGLANAKTKKDSAESALIYKDTVTALGAVREAKTILQGLACTTKTNSSACQALWHDLDALATKIRRLTIAPVEIITAWSAPIPEHIIKLNDTIIGFSSSTSDLVAFNLLTKEANLIKTFSTISGFISGNVPKENDYGLLRFNNKQLLSLDPKDNSAKILDVAYPADAVNVQNAVIYNRRLYSLDTLNNQIYKHDSLKTGFDLGKPWVKDSAVDLKNGSDLTIDGDLLIMKNDGQITKFTSGTAVPFTIQGLDPLLGPGSKIWTYNDVIFIYVLDPSNKRIVILNKDGTLDHQITAQEFVRPTDMIVDEPNNTAYVIDSGKLFKIPLK